MLFLIHCLVPSYWLKRLSRDSTRTPTDFHKTPSSSDWPKSLTEDHTALEARWDMLQQGEGKCWQLYQSFWCPCHVAKREDSDSSKHLCFWLRKSCTRQMWPGPRTDHVFCHSLGAVHFENLQFQLWGPWHHGSRYHSIAPKQVHAGYTDFVRSPKAQRTLAQGSMIIVYQIHSLYKGITAILKFFIVAWRIPRTEVPEKLGCVSNKKIKCLNFFFP